MRHSSLRISLIFILLLGLMSLRVAPFGTLILTAAQSEIVIDFDTFRPVPEALRQPILEVLMQNHALLHESGRFAVTDYRIEGNWAEVVITAQYIIDNAWEDINWDDIDYLIGYQTAPETWSFFLEGAPEFAPVAPLVPADFINYGILQQSDISEPLTFSTEHRFPWTVGQSWKMTQGNHSGAIDFAPASSSNPGVDYAVLASQFGVMRRACNDGFQALVQVEHPGAGTSGYRHIDAGSVPAYIGQAVAQGQYLGFTYNGTAKSDGVCDPVEYPNLRYNTRCGCGYGAHVHYEVPNWDARVEGIRFRDLVVNTWYQSHNNRIANPYPPGTPTITAPMHNSTVTSLAVNFVIQPGAINGIGWGNDWHLVVDNEPGFQSPTIYDQTITTTSVTVNVPSDGHYYARAWQGDTFAYISDWSSVIEFTVARYGDLSVSQQVVPATPASGEQVMFRVNVNNGGPSTSNSITLTDTLPDGVEFDSQNSSSSCNHTSGIVTCNVGSLNSGSNTSVNIVVRTNSDSTADLVNTAAVSSSNDNNTGNNSSTVTVTPVRVADTAITQTHQPEPVKAGQNVTLTLIVTNRGASSAANISVQDTLPAGLSFVSADYQSCTHVSGVVTCPISSLAPNASVQIGITAAVGLGTVGTVTNTATVTGNSDPNAADNTSSHNLTVVALTECEKADVNQDGRVNIIDLQLVASLFNVPRSDARYVERRDINLDGVINIIDLQRVAMQFGNTCAP